MRKVSHTSQIRCFQLLLIWQLCSLKCSGDILLKTSNMYPTTHRLNNHNYFWPKSLQTHRENVSDLNEPAW